MHRQVLYGLLRPLARLLVHPLWGRVIGASLVFVPMPWAVKPFFFDPVPSQVVAYVVAVPLFYLMLFLGALTHELGHQVALRCMGFQCNLQIMRNPHSRLIPFNMKTTVFGGSPFHSTTDKLLIRGVAGLLANLVAEALLLTVSCVVQAPAMAWFAVIQGFCAHGATSWASLRGDTDVRTIRDALSLRDDPVVKVTESGVEACLAAHIDLEVFSEDVTPYWVVVMGIAVTRSKCQGMFLQFDVGYGLAFILMSPSSGHYALEVRGKKTGTIRLLTKGGYEMVVSG